MSHPNLKNVDRLLAVLLSVILTTALTGLSFADQESHAPEAQSSQVVSFESTPGLYFLLDIETPRDGTTFILPTSRVGSSMDDFPYDWSIDWGDGSTGIYDGIAMPSSGINHTYPVAADYRITITPHGSTEAWLAAFGFSEGSEGPNTPWNAAMVTGSPCPLTPQMTRNYAQISHDAPAPDCEWTFTFGGCTNLVDAPVFYGWENVSAVSQSFAAAMFYHCSSLETLPEGFTLPQGITEADIGFANWMFMGCTSLYSLPEGFNLPPAMVTAGSGFASNMFYECSSLRELPAGFNLPQSITHAGDNFATGMFDYCLSLITLPQEFNLPQGIVEVGDGFASSMFNRCTDLEYLPDGFNLPQGLNEVGSFFASSMFYECASLKRLPDGFNLPQGIRIAGDFFASGLLGRCYELSALPDGFNLPRDLEQTGMSFAILMFTENYCLTMLPAGFNYPQGLTDAGDDFAQFMFGNCSNLTALPEGFTFPQGISSVGDSFAYYCFYDCSSLGPLPVGFNLPQNIADVGDRFAAYLFYLAGSPTFQINAEFRFPTGIGPDSSNAFYMAFALSSLAPAQSRTAASIIGGCPTPADMRTTFDTHFGDLDYIPINWGGKGLTPPVGAPGTGDLNGDGFVTMNEVLICAQASLGDIGLSSEQLAAIDMDGDGFITMYDVMKVYERAIM